MEAASCPRLLTPAWIHNTQEQQDALRGAVTVYGYDTQNRLVKEERRNASDQRLWQRIYAYDPAGNRERLDWHDGSTFRSSAYSYMLRTEFWS